MPSNLPLPTIADSLQQGKQAIVGTREEFADIHSGSIYDYLMGTAALAWAREAQADQDKFRGIYFTTAQNDDLTTYVQQRFGIARIMDSYGVGSCLMQRQNFLSGAGIIYAGTHVQVATGMGGSIVYEVVNDVTCGPTQLLVPVEIRATTSGGGVAITNGSGSIVDPLWDDSFIAIGLYCGNGTSFEAATDFRARVVQQLLNQRPGYPAAIKAALLAIGAPNVVLFPSNYQGIDSGINACYVGDANYQCSQALLIDSRVNVEGTRVLGADLEVFPMATSLLSVALTLNLWDDPSKFDVGTIKALAIAGVLQYFGNSANAFAYKRDGIAGSAQRTSNAIQQVTVTSPTVDATFSSSNWPSTLTRYTPTGATVAITILGPQ